MKQQYLWCSLLGSFALLLAGERLGQAQSRESNKQFQEQMKLLAARVAALEATTAAYKTQLQTFTTLLSCMKQENHELIVEGCNVHIRNGSGTTDGPPNGLGNLIIGYNEERSGQTTRTGSHNIVIGMEHSYGSVAGLVAGYNNTLAGPHSTISGGLGNVVRSEAASICGGMNNTVTGEAASISGGFKNTASGTRASVSGGFGNEVGGSAASISGGLNRTTTREFSWRAGELQQEQ